MRRYLAGAGSRRVLGFLLVVTALLCNPLVLHSLAETPPFGVMGATRVKIYLTAALLALSGIWMLSTRSWGTPREFIALLSRYPRAGGVTLGLAMTIGLFLFFELTLAGLNKIRASAAPFRQRDAVSTSPTNDDPVLGYRPRPNEIQRDRMLLDGAPMYDVTYTIDANGHRVVPASGDTSGRDKPLVFFGCSYTFGVGCNDDETLPNAVAELAPAYRVHNLAYGGYGPHHMLAMLEDPTCLDFVSGKNSATGIFVFIRRHVRRVVPCVPMIQRPWIRYAPCYQLNEQGIPTRRGLFPDAMPWRVAFYDLLAYEQLREFLDVNYPLYESPADLELTAKVIRAAADRFRAALPGSGFHVLLYPALHDSPEEARECGKYFLREGLNVFDLSEMFSDNPMAQTIPGDGHPTPATHRAVAEALVPMLQATPAT